MTPIYCSFTSCSFPNCTFNCSVITVLLVTNLLCYPLSLWSQSGISSSCLYEPICWIEPLCSCPTNGCKTHHLNYSESFIHHNCSNYATYRSRVTLEIRINLPQIHTVRLWEKSGLWPGGIQSRTSVSLRQYQSVSISRSWLRDWILHCVKKQHR